MPLNWLARLWTRRPCPMRRRRVVRVTLSLPAADAWRARAAGGVRVVSGVRREKG